MRDKKITTSGVNLPGVNLRFPGTVRQSFADVFGTSALVVICTFLIILATGEVRADDQYFDGGVANSVFADDYDSVTAGVQSCGSSSCHDEPAAVCTGSFTTNFSNYDCAFDFRNSIVDRLTSPPPSMLTPMPSGGPFTRNADFLLSLGTWDTAGYAKAQPIAFTTSSTYVSQTQRQLNGRFNPNTRGMGGTYGFFWETSSPPGILTSTPTITGTSLSPLNPPLNRTISGLVCGQQYFYQARATNGGTIDDLGSILNFTISCTAPVISPPSSATVIMSEDGSPTPFEDAAPNLSVTDDDAGTLSWSVSSPPVIQGTTTAAGSATASGTGNNEMITYTPPPNFVGVVEFTVRATNTTTNLFDEHTITVDVTPVNDPPVITEGPGPLNLAAILEDGSTMHILNATDIDMDTINWSIVSGPNHGMVSGATGTGASKTLTYTPGEDVITTGTYTVRVTALSQTDDIVVNVPITPVNDSPLIDPVGGQAATEGVLLTVTPVVDDPDDPNDGSGALSWSIISPNPVEPGMAISNTGVFTWTPPLGTAPTPAVFNDMYPVTIRVQDDTVGSTPDTESFIITVNPPDGDADMVADYNDYCPTTADGTNADFDGDGTRGTDVDPNDNTGGDVCDADDDNDGMPDAFEISNSLNPFDAADAALDADGDGISNLQEFLDGTNPNLANLVIDATGYFTPYDLIPPDPTIIHFAATAVTANDYGPYRPGDNTITWKPSNGSSANLAMSDPGNLVSNPPEQQFFVRPLVNLATNQLAEEGAAVTVDVNLNGNPPAYPVTINYTVSGTASTADHSAVAGVVTFNAPSLAETISFNLATDAISDPNETVVFTISSTTNAAIGSKNSHQVTIVEDNVAPRAELRFTQGGNVLSATYAGDGAIDIDAIASDVNAGQTPSFDWSGTDNALLPPGNVANWQVAAPVAGNFLIDVVVTDNGTPPLSTRVSRILNIAPGGAPALGAIDSDLDGLSDNDLLEGYADDDSDGIPNYLDAIDSGNLVPDQTVNMSSSFLLETEPGLRIARGNTAQASSSFGALLTDTEIAQFGSVIGDPPANPDDSLDHVGGIYDFEIRGLIPGAVARVVIPLRNWIPRNAQYRKFNPATGWGVFAADNNNQVASAPGALGACPEPGSSAYRSGLNYLDHCVQLTIRDGGPNDTDNMVNGIIDDPGTIGVRLTEPSIEEVEDGSGRISLQLLAILMLLLGIGAWRQHRSGKLD